VYSNPYPNTCLSNRFQAPLYFSIVEAQVAFIVAKLEECIHLVGYIQLVPKLLTANAIMLNSVAIPKLIEAYFESLFHNRELAAAKRSTESF
jgi:hypothetical protein